MSRERYYPTDDSPFPMEEGPAGRHAAFDVPVVVCPRRARVPHVGCSTAGETHYSIPSGAFQIGGHTWALDCSFNRQGHLVSIFLELLTPYIAQDLVVAKAGLKIEDPLGRLPAIEWRSEEAHTFTIWSGDGSGSEQTGGRSWKLSVPEEFRGNESRYVQDDRLTILCTVEVLQEEHNSTIADDIHKLLFLPSEPDQKYSESERTRHACMLPDVTFVVEQTEIPAHRLVLAMRSPVFAAELLGDMRESTARRVRVDDMRASTFRAMIRFIYTDELPIKAIRNDASQRACKDKCAAKRRVAMACDLLAAADRYDLEKLRLMCEEVLYESMDAASVVPTLLVAHGRYNCRQLEASCIEYLASEAAVRATDEYKQLEEGCKSLVVEAMNKVGTRKLAGSSSSLDIASNPRRAKKMSVSTYNTSKVVSGTHEMRIPNFSSQHGVGRTIYSNTFQIDGCDWKLVVDPGLRTEGCICVFAHLLTDPGIAGVRAYVCFRMSDPNGKSAPTQGELQTIFTRKAPSKGYNFTDTKYAEQHYLAHDGSLTIHCNIIVTNKTCCVATGTASSGVGDTTLAPTPDIARHLEELLASQKGSDVTFLVENREIRAHKLLIAARSPVLYEMVVGVANMEAVVPVDDMKSAVFEAVLHFIYTGELPPMEDLALISTSSIAEDISFAMQELALAGSFAEDGGVLIVGDIMAAACRFSLDTMKAKCETLLAESIKKESARSTLRLARHHGCSKLENYCDQFVSSPYVAHYRARAERDMLERIFSSYSREKNSGL
jgi:speckle-type POZ protein